MKIGLGLSGFRNLTKKTLAYFLAIIMAVPLISFPTTAYGASFNDIGGHWAESYINKAVSAGFVKGYPDGTFCPDKAVSRAEFTSMINKALGITGSGSVSFKDVSYNEWYYNDVAKGISGGFVGGYDDNTFRPNNAVTREEAAVMISRFVPVSGSSGNTSTFKDRLSISTWANDAVGKIYGKGYMGSYPDGKYHPQDSLTRAQTAKILCSILDKETVVSSSTTITSKGSSISGRIYSNNVTMHSDLGNGSADISNCVILGTLYVYGGGENTITISNSRVANAYVERSSDAVRLLAKGQTTINNTTLGRTATLETSGLSGGLYGTGFNNVDIKGSADATLKGNFIKVNLTGSSAKVGVNSGTITTLNVSSSGRSSEITLDSGASIGTANVDAGVAFKGSGNINTMNVNSSGVTYETKPRYVKLGSGISAPGYEEDTGGDYDIEIDPKHKKTGVKTNTEITLTFKTAVKKYGGSTIRNSDINDMIYLRRDSSSGTKVSYSGSINSSRKVITLTPDKDLDDDTKYYVVIGKNEFLDTHDDGNSAQTTYFSTGDKSDDSVTFSPKSKATDVSRTVSPTIRFDEAVETYAGKSISDSYLRDSVITFRENSSSGSKVSFSASINSSKKTITIEPKSPLKEGQKYYLAIDNKKLRTQSGEKNIDASSVTWTVTGGTAPSVSFTPSNGTGNVALASNVTLNFSTSIYDTGGNSPSSSYITSNVTLRNNTANAAVPYALVTFSNNSGGASIVIRPNSGFVSGNNYTVSVPSSRFKNSSGVYMGGYSASFTAITNVDLKKLEDSLAAAKTTMNGVKVSATGTDILPSATWVTQPQWDALNSAITVATNIRTTATNTPQADTAAGVLNNATAVFNSSKRSGTKIPVDTSTITTALVNADTALKNTKVSNDGFDVAKTAEWVTQDVMNTFTSAINTAKAAIDTVQTPTQAFYAASALQIATITFNAAKAKGKLADKSALNSALSSARTNILSVVISSDGTDVSPSNKWVTQQSYDAYKNVILTSGGVADSSNSDQSMVDNALSALNTATDTFNGLKRDGSKSDTQPTPPTTPPAITP